MLSEVLNDTDLSRVWYIRLSRINLSQGPSICLPQFFWGLSDYRQVPPMYNLLIKGTVNLAVLHHASNHCCVFPLWKGLT